MRLEYTEQAQEVLAVMEETAHQMLSLIHI